MFEINQYVCWAYYFFMAGIIGLLAKVVFYCLYVATVAPTLLRGNKVIFARSLFQNFIFLLRPQTFHRIYPRRFDSLVTHC